MGKDTRRRTLGTRNVGKTCRHKEVEVSIEERNLEKETLSRRMKGREEERGKGDSLEIK